MSRPEDSLLGRALQTSIQLAADSAGQPAAEQPWAAQLARGLQHIGVPLQPEQRERIELAGVRRAALQRHLDRVDAATDGHSRLRHYFREVRPELLLLLLLLLHPLTSLSDDGSPGAVHAGRKRTGTA